MTGYGESHFSAEGVQIVCAVRSLNSRFLDVDLDFPEELAWFRAHSEAIARRRFSRGKIEIAFQTAAQLPVDVIFNTEILAQYEKFLATRLKKKKVNLEPRDYIGIPGFFERRVKNWRTYQSKFDFHLMRALIKMERSRTTEGKRTVRECMTHLRYLARVQRQIGILQAQVHKKKLMSLRHRIYHEFFDMPGVVADGRPSMRDKMQVANLIWTSKKDELVKAVHSDASEEISRIGMHIQKMLAIFRKKEAAGRELEFFLQELQREANTLGAKAQDGEISSLTVIMKTEIEKLREQVRNLE